MTTQNVTNATNGDDKETKSPAESVAVKGHAPEQQRHRHHHDRAGQGKPAHPEEGFETRFHGSAEGSEGAALGESGKNANHEEHHNPDVTLVALPQ